MKGYQLKITIKGSKPPIWRRVVVPEQITFHQLHQVIQEAFGWWDYHLHEFEFKKLGLLIKKMEEPDDLAEQRSARIEGEDNQIDRLITENPRFVYIYDFGDTWEHQILMEKEVDYDFSYPQVLKYKGDNIPEDCGGIGGYYELLDQLADPKAKEHAVMVKWARQQGMGEYDQDAVNAKMMETLDFVQGSMDEDGGAKGQAGDSRSTEGRTTVNQSSKGQTPKPADSEAAVQAAADPAAADLTPQDLTAADLASPDRTSPHPSTVQTINTLEELYGRFEKSELLRIAKVHHIIGCDEFGKGKLASMLAGELLEPERMGRFFGTLGDEAIAEFERAAGACGMECRGDQEALSFLHYGGYCGFANNGNIVAAKDVADAYQKFNTEQFQAARHYRSTVWACCKAAVYLYGAADAGQVENICRAVGCDADTDEILRLNREMKGIWTDFAYWDSRFIDWDLVKGDLYKDVLRYQRGKEFYVPTLQQVNEIFRTGAVELKKHIRPLKAFFLSMIGCSGETAQEAASSIHHHIRLGTTPRVVEEIMEHFDLNLDSQEKMDGFDEIMEQVWKETRTVGNCGFSRAEMDARTAHIDPDAPCPCGSGKRYRQCCGRK